MSLPTDIIQLFGTGSVPVVVAGSVFVLFSYLDSISSPQSKWFVTTWIRRAPDNATNAVAHGKDAWVVLFSSTFDRVFGTELFSWKRVARSWAISSFVVIVVTLLWGVIRRDQFYALFERTHQDVKGIFTGILFSAYLFNLIPDYISAIQTQHFVRFVQHRNLGWLATSSVLIGDFLSKTLIFLFFYSLAVMGLFGLLYTYFKDVRDVWDATTFTNISDAIWWFLRYGPTLSVEKIGNPSIGIFYYSTFFPSVWLWFLILSLYAFRFAYLIIGAARFANWFLDVEKKPFTSIGAAAATLAFIVSVAIILVSAEVSRISAAS